LKSSIGKRSALIDGGGLCFEVIDSTISKREQKKAQASGAMKTGFAVEFADSVYAYENRCPHLGVELDWALGVFFDEAREYLVCSTHGAHFEPDTGKCVSGPCEGQSLIPLALLEEEGELFTQGSLMTNINGS
jgi:nitrite reductase/ring-hydroxylating ferredoxin subunit